MHLHPVVPILRSYNESKAREFYIDWLGFKADWEQWGAREMVVQDGAGNRLVFFRDP